MTDSFCLSVSGAQKMSDLLLEDLEDLEEAPTVKEVSLLQLNWDQSVGFFCPTDCRRVSIKHMNKL